MLFDETLLRIKARLRALFPADWLGVAGDKFRQTGAVLAEYSREHIRPEERLDELPDLAWNRVKGEANEKHSQALVNFADEEAKKIANELARRTADDQAREAKASADKMEAEARLSQSSDMAARIALVERCRALGVLPVWDQFGHMTFLKAPKNLDWNELTQKLLDAEEPTRIAGSRTQTSPAAARKSGSKRAKRPQRSKK